MKPENKRFFTSLLLVLLVTVGITFLMKLLMPQCVTSLCWALLPFFTLVSIVVYFLTMKVRAKNDIHKFTNFYMVTTVTKLVLYLLVIFIYSMTFKEDSKAFIVTFLVYYLCFSVFETIVLAKKNK